jgi:hypothetical protein
MAASGITDMPTTEQLDQVLQVAIQAAKSAGKIIMENSEGSDVVEKKASSRDLLTLIDPLCEKVRKVACLMARVHSIATWKGQYPSCAVQSHA